MLNQIRRIQMAKLKNQLLMLGGFYFIVSFVLNSFRNSSFFYSLFITFLVLFVAVVAWLCYKKNFAFLDKFADKNPKTTNYLKAVGVAQYFTIFFGMIPSLIVGPQEDIPAYFTYASVCYLIILFVSLVYATYLNIPKANGSNEVKKVTKKAPAKKKAKK